MICSTKKCKFIRRVEKYRDRTLNAGIATDRVMKRINAALIPLKGSNRKADHRAIITGLKRGFLSKDTRAFIRSYFFFQIFPKQPFRFNKQYYNEDDESICILVFT